MLSLQVDTLLGLGGKEVGQVGAGKDRRSGLVDLAMIQSLKARDDLQELMGQYGLLVMDECHHLPAFSFESCVKQAPLRYFLGLTATPYRRDGLQDIITMQCGPIRHRIFARDVTSGAELSLRLEVRETSFCFDGPEEAPIQDVFRALVNEDERSDHVVRDVLDAIRVGRRCLVLSQWKEHCRALADRLGSHGKQAFVLDGGLRKKAREAMFEAVRSAPPESELVVIATGQYLGEGFDCPQLDTLFLAFPIAFKGRLVQYAGRLLRPCEGKTGVQVFDYADVEVPVLRKMHEKRLRTYESLGFMRKEEQS